MCRRSGTSSPRTPGSDSQELHVQMLAINTCADRLVSTRVEGGGGRTLAVLVASRTPSRGIADISPGGRRLGSLWLVWVGLVGWLGSIDAKRCDTRPRHAPSNERCRPEEQRKGFPRCERHCPSRILVRRVVRPPREREQERSVSDRNRRYRRHREMEYAPWTGPEEVSNTRVRG